MNDICAIAFDPFQYRDEWRMLVQALDKELRVRVQRSGGFLRFDGGVARVDPPEDAAFGGAAAAEKILARRSVFAVVAVGAERAHTESEQLLVREHDEDPESVHRCQWVPS